MPSQHQALPQFITAKWPAPSKIKACTTTRHGGLSKGPYASLNVNTKGGDDPQIVAANRDLLKTHLNLPSAPYWLHQVRGATVVPYNPTNAYPEADGCYANEPGQVCAIVTADCLPILLCAEDKPFVMALHAGWQGLSRNIIAQGLSCAPSAPEKLLAWIGPCISGAVYEVGADLYERFIGADADTAAYFQPKTTPNKWLLDLVGIARLQLERLGVTKIYGVEWCTLSQPEQFFSYRRDGKACGGMASLIWIDEAN